MSSIAAINSQMSASFAAPAAAPAVGDAAGVGAAAGATSVQTSSLMSIAQDGASIDGLAALALALLLQKSSDSKQADDPWKVLVGMAMLGMLGRNSGDVTVSQDFSVTTQAYGAQGAAAPASGFTAQA